jgi:hypothetical protein
MSTQAGALNSPGASNRGCLRAIQRLPYGSDVAVQGLCIREGETRNAGSKSPCPLIPTRSADDARSWASVYQYMYGSSRVQPCSCKRAGNKKYHIAEDDVSSWAKDLEALTTFSLGGAELVPLPLQITTAKGHQWRGLSASDAEIAVESVLAG